MIPKEALSREFTDTRKGVKCINHLKAQFPALTNPSTNCDVDSDHGTDNLLLFKKGQRALHVGNPKKSEFINVFKRTVVRQV